MSWDGDISRMGKLSENIASLARVPSQASARIAVGLGALIEHEFSTGTDPYGNAWAPLAPRTLARGRTSPPLTDTGSMRDSALARPMPSAGVSITIDHPAAPHQTGWHGIQGDGPARPILPSRQMPAEWRALITDEIREAARAT